MPGSSIWHPFDPSGETLPEPLAALPEPEGEDGGVVALVASASAAASWGPRAAVGIARSLAERGAKVILADLGLEAPSLHRVAGMENVEGMADFFLFGASIPRIARPMDEGAFFLAPAGTIVPDPAAIMAHGRWRVVEEGFGSAAALLLLYVPEGDACLSGVLERSGRVVFLGEEDGVSPAEVLASGADRLVAALNPLGDLGEMQREAEKESAPTEEAERARERPGRRPSPTASKRSAPETAATAAGASAAEESPRAAPAESQVETRPRQRSAPPPRRTSSWLLIVLLLVVAGAAAAVWFGYVEIPGLDLSGAGRP